MVAMALKVKLMGASAAALYCGRWSVHNEPLGSQVNTGIAGAHSVPVAMETIAKSGE